MKNYYLVLTALLFFTLQLKAQTPNLLNYQGVARNASGLVVPNQLIGLRFIIHQGNALGSAIYTETQTTTTNLLGLFTVTIGSGSPSTFAGIVWGSNTEYLEVDMDVTGGTAYVPMGTTQFLSVPYALNAGSSNTSWNVTGNGGTGGVDYIGTTDANDLILKANNIELMRLSNANGNVGIGTNAPNAAAALDVTSTTKGLLIPRSPNPPANPVAGLMYYNNISGCFFFYTGTSWQSIVCPCPNALAATPVVGPSSICPNTAGNVYSVAPLNNATLYTWVYPTNATVLGGQGSNIITFTTGVLSSPSVKVTASNNCGSGTQASLTLTANTLATASPQPLAQNVTAGATVTFTSGGSGSGTSLQWQVSTDAGAHYTNLVNNATYSNVTGTVLTITSVTAGLNGNLYRMSVPGTCNTAFSNGVALGVCTGAPGVPGSITATSASFCAGTTGLVFSVSPTANSTFYNWTVPAAVGSIVGTSTGNSITVTAASGSGGTGNISVTASTACATSVAGTPLSVTDNAATAITTQPTSTVASATFANFSVGATVGSTYQWMVSTTGIGGTYASITNNATYSGAQLSTLTINNPNSSMLTYYFEVSVNGLCPGTPIISNPVQITSICSSPTSPSVLITIHNSAGSPTTANLPVKISPLNFSTFSGNEDANLDNIEFSVGGSLTNGGTALYAWIENGSAATPATVPTSASTAAIVWVNLGAATIGAGGNLSIYMNFMSSPVMGTTTSHTGMAPQLTASTVGYGVWDNGAQVFTFYDNFAGTTLNTTTNYWTQYSNVIAPPVVNNGITFNSGTAPNGTNDVQCISTNNSYGPNTVGEIYESATSAASAGNRSYMPGFISASATIEGNYLGDMYFGVVNSGVPNPVNFVAVMDGVNGMGPYYFEQGNTTPNTFPWFLASGNFSLSGANILGIYYTGSANSFSKNYVSTATVSTYSPTTPLFFALGVDANNGGPSSFSAYWARVRVYPPAGADPTATVGSLSCN